VADEIRSPEQFKALGHPMRHRLLFALGQREATISQLAVELHSNKGNVAHHLKVLADAGLVTVAARRPVRGGTEVYYRRSTPAIEFADPDTTAIALRAIVDEIATAVATPVLTLRNVRLSPSQVARLTAVLEELARDTDDAGPEHPRYGLLVGLYQPG